MSHKKRVTGNKMSVTDINDPLFAGASAKRMAADLLRKYHLGPGDTNEAAALRVQRELKVDANIIMQGWNRPARAMMAHRWLPLFKAWCEAGFAKIDEAYEEERARHDENSALVRLADLVAGKAIQKEKVK